MKTVSRQMPIFTFMYEAGYTSPTGKNLSKVSIYQYLR